MKILVTGGAGFVGSFLAGAFRASNTSTEIVVLDNLKRRGSELNLPRFKKLGIRFVHGDIRNPADFEDLGSFDVLLECSAEPSVLAGTSGSPNYVLQTNLVGTLNCLEFAREHAGALVFLSTSRVYSIAPLRELPLTVQGNRFEWQGEPIVGASASGISENFPTQLPRSFYGASKLASEMVIQEYSAAYKLPTIINRCGTIAGPGQFGKTDQGVFTLWVASHYFGLPLAYRGFGGDGLQVRDLLHPEDLFELIRRQIDSIKLGSGAYNVGGGRENSVSLAEYTSLCEAAVGRSARLTREAQSAAVDIPWFISDNARVAKEFGWAPKKSPAQIVNEVYSWIREHESALAEIFGGK